MANYFARQIKLIEDSRSLQILALGFSLVYVVIFISGWIDNWWIPYYLSSDSTPICSALFEECYRYRLPFEIWKIIWWVFGGLAVLCPLLLAAKKVREAYWLFIFLAIFELFVTFSDYRIWYSHFYISSFVILPFLLMEPKPLLSAVMLAVCYWWAGLLKVNSAWWSGETLKTFWHVFPQWLPEQASFVILMELVLVWLLFSKKRKIFWPVFSLFVLFHILSWHVVGFFYPLVMFSLLPVFVALYLQPQSFKNLLKPAPVLLLTFFCLLQIPPYFQNEKEALWGGGRMFYSLHMFHRHIQCRAEASYVENGEEKKIDLKKVAGSDIAVRIACEPLVSINAARYLCRTKQFSGPVRVEHWSKLISGETFQPIYQIDDFCHQKISYHFLGKNSWMNSMRE